MQRLKRFLFVIMLILILAFSIFGMAAASAMSMF